MLKKKQLKYNGTIKGSKSCSGVHRSNMVVVGFVTVTWILLVHLNNIVENNSIFIYIKNLSQNFPEDSKNPRHVYFPFIHPNELERDSFCFTLELTVLTWDGPQDNCISSINLTCMFSDSGRKQDMHKTVGNVSGTSRCEAPMLTTKPSALISVDKRFVVWTVFLSKMTYSNHRTWQGPHSGAQQCHLDDDEA